METILVSLYVSNDGVPYLADDRMDSVRIGEGFCETGQDYIRYDFPEQKAKRLVLAIVFVQQK